MVFGCVVDAPEYVPGVNRFGSIGRNREGESGASGFRHLSAPMFRPLRLVLD
jgi:hypothetical protein